MTQTTNNAFVKHTRIKKLIEKRERTIEEFSTSNFDKTGKKSPSPMAGIFGQI